MKPLLVYGPAMELGVSAPGSVIADAPYVIRGWTPGNFTRNRYYGLVSTRFALANSYNASAVGTYMKIMDQKPTQFLEKMGFTTLDPDEYAIHPLHLGG